MITPLPVHRATSANLRRVDPRIEAEVRAANLPRLMAIADLVRRELDATRPIQRKGDRA